MFPCRNLVVTLRLELVSRALLLLMLALSANLAQAVPINVCSQSASYYNILGGNSVGLRSKLVNTAVFGPSGTYGDFQFTFQTFGSPVNAGLSATCDIWFSGYEHDSTYTAAEITAVQTFAANGGSIIAGCDSTSYDPVCNGLGATVTTDSDSYSYETAEGAAISCASGDNALEEGDAVEMAGGVGGYFATTPPGTVTTLTVHETGGIADPSKPTSYVVEPASGSGMYGMFTDINMIQAPTISAGNGVTNNNDIFTMDIFALAARVSQGGSFDSCGAEIQVTKTVTAVTTVNGADPSLADVGDEVTYSFTVLNTGDATLTAVGLTDSLVTNISCAPTTIASGVSATCSGDPYEITQADVDAGGIENTATGTGTPPDGPAVTDVSDAGNETAETEDLDGNIDGDPTNDPTVELLTQTPEITVTKTVTAVTSANGSDASIVDADDEVTYSFTVLNSGNVTLSSIGVTDSLVSNIVCAPTTLAPGASATCSGDAYVIAQADVDAGGIENTATGSGTPPDGPAVTDVSDAGDETAETEDLDGDTDGDPTNDPTVELLTQAPEITVTKTVTAVTTANGADTGLVDAGDEVTYSFTVLNSGNVTLTAVGITDSLVTNISCTPTTLAPGTSATCSGDPYVIVQADVDAGGIENSATGTGTPPDGPPVTDVSDAGDETDETEDLDGATDGDPTNDPTVVLLAQSPEITVTKTVTAVTTANGSDATIVDAGDEVTYSFTVLNSGSVSLTAIGITDSLVTNVSCTPTSLAPGASATCSGDAYEITQADVDAGGIENTATGTGTPPVGPPVTDVSDAGDETAETGDLDGATDGDPTNDPTVELLTQTPEITVTKTVTAVTTANGSDAAIVDANDEVTYSFTVLNSGNVTLTAIGINDSLVTNIVCAPTTLAPGASATCSGDAYTITQADVDAGGIENTATGSGTPPDGPAVTDVSDAGDETAETEDLDGDTDGDPTNDPTVELLTQVAEITVTKSVTAVTTANGADTGLVDAGDEVTYSFTVLNSGSVTLTAIGITDSLVTNITCTPTTLAPGTSAACSGDPYVIVQADVDAGGIENTATGTGTPPDGPPVTDVSDAGDETDETEDLDGDTDGDPTNDPTVELLTQAPEITVTKSVTAVTTANGSDAGIVDANDEVTYSFTVLNSGNVTLTAIGITDSLVTNIACTPTTLAPGASATCSGDAYTITQADVDAGGIENTATGTGTPPDGPPVTDVSDAGDETDETEDLDGDTDGDPTNDPTVELLTQVPEITVTKTVTAVTTANGSNATIVDADDEVTYSFTVLNSGNVTLTAIAITDSLVTNIACTPTTLAPGASATCTGDAYVITQVDVDAGGIENTATGSGTPPDGPPVTDVSDAGDETDETEDLDGDTDGDPTNDPTVELLPAEPELTVTKTVTAVTTGNGSDATIVDADDEVTYSFTVLNSGNVTLTAIAITDSLVTNISCTPTTLAPGASATCSGDPYVITQADVDAGGIENTATGTGTPPDGPPVTDVSDAGDETEETEDLDGDTDDDPTNDPTVELLPAAPEITVTKTVSAVTSANGADATIVDADDEVSYSFNVLNSGNVTLTAIGITDSLVTNISCTPTTLAPGASATCSGDAYVITQADVDAGGVENTATGSGTPPDGPPVTDVSDAGDETEETEDLDGDTDDDPTNDPTVELFPALPEITVTKTVTAVTTANGTDATIVDADDEITYSFTVLNSGNVTLTAIGITDSLVTNISCTPTSLAPGASATCSGDAYVITQADVDAGGVENTATGTGTPPDGPPVTDVSDAGDETEETEDLDGDTDDDPTNDPTVELLSAEPEITVTKTVTEVTTSEGANPDIVDADDEVTYSFTVLNSGNVTLTAIAITDSLVTNISCTPTSLAPGATATCSGDVYVITQLDVDAGGVENTATGSGTPPDGPPVTDVSDAGDETEETEDLDGDTDDDPTNDPTVELFPAEPEITVTKTVTAVTTANGADATIVDADDEVTYSFTVLNSGNVTLTAVGITDSLVTNISCTPTTLAPGASATCSGDAYVITQADVDAGGVENTATGSGTPPDGPPVTDVSDAGDETEETEDLDGDTDDDPTNDPTVELFPAEPEITVTKTVTDVTSSEGVDPDIIDADDEVSYSFTVLNNGNVTLTAIGITDSLVTNIICTPATLAPGASATCSGDAYVITQADVDAGGVENTATGSGTPPDGPPVTDVSDAGDETEETEDLDGDTDDDPTNDPTVELFPAEPEITVTKTVTDVTTSEGVNPDIIDADDEVSYSFNVLNSGNVTLTAVSITDPMITNIVCTPTTIAPAVSATCSGDPFVISQDDIDAGGIENTATGSGTPPDGPPVTDVSDAGNETEETEDLDGDTDDDPTNDPTVLILDSIPELTVTKTVTGVTTTEGTNANLTDAGDEVSYSFNVVNTGNVPLTNPGITDQNVANIVCSPTALAPGEVATCSGDVYVITQADIEAGGVENTATGSGTPPDGPPVTDISDAGDETEETEDLDGETDDDPTNDPTVQTFPQVYDLSIDKILSPTQALWVVNGETVNYEITVTNDGNLPSGTFSIIDTVPAGLSFVSASGAGFSCAPDTPTLGIIQCDYTPSSTADIAPQQSVQIDLALMVNDLAQAPFTNHVEISQDSADDFGLTDSDSTPGSNGAAGDNGPGEGTPGEDEDDASSAVVRGAATTPVTLKSIRSSLKSGQVSVSWSTSMEDGNQGFILYGREVDGPWRSLHDEMIPTKAVDDEGTVYRHEFEIDFDVAELSITDVDLFGSEIVHGPFSVGQHYGDHYNGAIESTRRMADDETVSRRRSESGKADPKSVYLVTDRTGVYRVTYTQLRDFGVDYRGVAAQDLALVYNGNPVAIRVVVKNTGSRTPRFGKGSWIEFLVSGTDSIYTDSQVYKLVVDSARARRIPIDRIGRTGAKPLRRTGAAVMHWEPERHYSRVSPKQDPWYALKLSAINIPLSRKISVNLPKVTSNEPGRLTVDVWGFADNPRVRRDHHLKAYINGVYIDDLLFDGYKAKTLDAKIRKGVLRDGENTVTLELPLDRGSRTDTIIIDSVKIQYERTLEAINGSLSIESTRPGSYRVTGLKGKNVSVYGISDDSVVHIKPKVSMNKDGSAVRFGAVSGAQGYAIADRVGRQTPTLKRVPASSDLTDEVAQYLVISHPRFIGDELNRLLRVRQQEGFSTRVVNVNHVYATYSDGTVDPMAIKAFIADAHEKMQTQYVLLVGGDTYDYKSHLKRTRRNQDKNFAQSMLPSLYARTGQAVRHAPVDPLYGDVDDDGLPDVAIGRLPVQTMKDLSTVIDKTLRYTSAHTERNAVFVADGVDSASQRSFSDVSRAARLKLEKWRVNFIDREQIAGKTVRKRLLNVIDKGRALTVYFGHSDMTSWGFDGLVRGVDLVGLNNSATPTAVLQFGCWNTYYVDPRANTLAHNWLLEGSHGAAIVMGATTLTEAGSEQDFATYIMENIAAGHSYGDAVLKAKHALANQYGVHSVQDLLGGFVILGDPALVPARANTQ